MKLNCKCKYFLFETSKCKFKYFSKVFEMHLNANTFAFDPISAMIFVSAAKRDSETSENSRLMQMLSNLH